MIRLGNFVAGGFAVAFLAAVTPVSGQQTQTPEAPAVAPGLEAEAEPCAIDPDAKAAQSPGGEERDEDGAADSSLSATLDRCGGVLKPPAVGDPDMVEPAPDAGVTPIIPPSAVPEDE
ncbi:hypothetical protein [Aquibium microcysteis]|uniref:hypothetical protein n=1 Tax=Aquibium microcysteis TaxID=675281 RepID=UPI00165D046C|nr:hypothetical protein [Aquibium microcysteis]